MSRTDWMTITEAAEALGVHYKTVNAWVKNGTLPSRRMGRLYRIPRNAVDGMLEAPEVAGKGAEEKVAPTPAPSLDELITKWRESQEQAARIAEEIEDALILAQRKAG